MNSHKHTLSVRSYLLLLATSLSKASCSSERSASVTIPKFPAASSGLCSCRGDPLVSSLIGINVKKNSWGAILLRPSAKRMLQNFKCLDHGLTVQMFRSQVSTVVTTANSSHLDVAIDHETLQPQRWGRDVSDASSTSSHCNGSPCRCVQLDFKGLSIPSPGPFALTSTPCRCKTTPRSRITETQPIPAAAAFTAA